MSAGVRWRLALLGLGLTAMLLSWLALRAYQSTPTLDAVAPVESLEAAARKPSAASRGIVQAIREVPAEAHSGVRRFEMTIRMRDGTTRISHGTGDTRWRAGDPISLIGGPGSR